MKYLSESPSATRLRCFFRNVLFDPIVLTRRFVAYRFDARHDPDGYAGAARRDRTHYLTKGDPASERVS
jgi:hypothetical protein